MGKDIVRLARNEIQMDSIRNILKDTEDYLPMEKFLKILNKNKIMLNYKLALIKLNII